MSDEVPAQVHRFQTSLDDVTSVLVFTEVVAAGSYSLAAKRLGLSKSAVSKRVSGLEERLGVRLLTRTTRRLATTEAGATLYERCARLRIDADDAVQEASALHLMPRGLLRVNAAAAVAHRYIAPLVPEFLARHPGLSMELAAVDRYIDPIAEGYDVAIRVGRLAESSLITRKLAVSRRCVVGSPEYLARRGVPREPRDLTDHDCVHFTLLSLREEWRFAGRDGVEFSVPVHGTYAGTDAATIIPAVLGGVGLAVVPSFIVAPEIQRGVLRTVLDDWMPAASGVYAVHAHQRQIPAKVKAFVDFLTEKLKPQLAS